MPTLVRTGAPMPDLTLVDATGARTSLHGLRGEQSVVVYFMRTSTCPVCHQHVRALATLAAAGELGSARVVAVTPGGAAEAQAVARRVPGSGSPGTGTGAGTSSVGVWASEDAHAAVGLGRSVGLQHSGTFLVSGAGQVAYARTSALPVQAFSRRELLAALDS